GNQRNPGNQLRRSHRNHRNHRNRSSVQTGNARPPRRSGRLIRSSARRHQRKMAGAAGPIYGAVTRGGRNASDPPWPSRRKREMRAA
ncbi:MAG TPA: hypothetical protein VFQ32_10125, partial [Ktedonobacterales bacterium]|nr:hypothetical protein [Ktedonobacterales bacterium]